MAKNSKPKNIEENENKSNLLVTLEEVMLEVR